MIDVYGSTSIHDEFWKCTSHCRYRATCPIKKKLVMDAVKTGRTITLEEVRAGDDSEKAYYDVRSIESPISPLAYAHESAANLKEEPVIHLDDCGRMD